MLLPDAALPPISHPDELTPRQREILDLIATGATDRQIALALFISTQTVKNHCTAIYLRLPIDRSRSPRVLAALWYSRHCGEGGVISG